MLITNISKLYTFVGAWKKRGRKITDDDIGPIIENAAIALEGNRIIWVGRRKDVPDDLKRLKEFDAEGSICLPGFVDCHTHLVFSGSRHKEFEMRAKGASYLEIAQAGGGILSTVKATREASKDELYELARSRLERATSYGITTIEIKSGYGLDQETEVKMLEVMDKLNRSCPQTIVPTFLGAHAIPPEFRDKKSGYVELVCDMIPMIAGKNLAKFVDVFCEKGFFDLEDTIKILTRAKEFGLGIKVHSDEFYSLGATEWICANGGASADHLIAITDKGIEALSKSNTVAVLLPMTSLFLDKPYAPARKLLDSGACVAIATDYNPGSSHTQNIILATTLACAQMKMTVAEAMSAITVGGALACGLYDRGRVEVGARADLSCFDASDISYLPYSFGEIRARLVICGGKISALHYLD